MNAAMAGETGRVGESLATANVGALVRLLASVRANVNRQSAALDEALAATVLVAAVRALVGVNAVVSLEIRLAVEALKSASQQWATRRDGRLGAVLTLSQDSQVHWKGRGLFSSWMISTTSIVVVVEGFLLWWAEEERKGVGVVLSGEGRRYICVSVNVSVCVCLCLRLLMFDIAIS